MQASDRNGALVGALLVGEQDEIMLISDQGTLVRTRVGEVPSLGRNTQGVRLINLEGEDRLVAIAKVLERDDAPGDGGPDEGGAESEPQATIH